MKVRIVPFRLPKEGNEWVEYEDACLPTRCLERESALFRLAAADGATESSFAQLWARLLVSAFVQKRLSQESLENGQGLRPLQQLWADRVRKRPLPGYAAQKMQLGAYAAFLGFVLGETETGRTWHACAAGDCCLMQVRNDELTLSWPLDRADQFDSTPALLSTNSEMNSPGSIHTYGGRWEPGDRFYLMTDALASWYVRSKGSGGKPWEKLDTLAAQAEQARFKEWVSDLRAGKEIRNDDVTLLCVILT